MQNVTEQVFLGRREILTDAQEITADNVLDELVKALSVHEQNRSEIQYLWNYYRGDQPILAKTRKVRPEINHKIVINKAHEIVDFHTSYVCGEPITYISRSDDEKLMNNINKLNDAMFTLGKADQDTSLIEWDMICGTAYRYISTEEEEDIPFKMFTLDPRSSFVVYSSDIRRRRMMGVTYYAMSDKIISIPVVGKNSAYNDVVFEIYTDKWYFKVIGGKIVEKTPHAIGYEPIVEYPANKSRQGAFEIALPLLDALNAAVSGQLDSVDLFVNAFMKFVNCDVDNEKLELMKEYGAIKIKSEPNLPADVDIVSNEMDQTQTQTLVNSLENQIVLICALPSRGAGGDTSTSDTGRAVELRNGWVSASAKAKTSETFYNKSDKETLKIICKICGDTGYLDLKASDIKAQFTRRNYDNIQSKSQVLISMLQNPQIDPKLAFEYCGLFTDPEAAYKQSSEYYEEYKKEQRENQQAITGNEPGYDNTNEERTSKTQNVKGDTISNPILKGASETTH